MMALLVFPARKDASTVQKTNLPEMPALAALLHDRGRVDLANDTLEVALLRAQSETLSPQDNPEDGRTDRLRFPQSRLEVEFDCEWDILVHAGVAFDKEGAREDTELPASAKKLLEVVFLNPGHHFDTIDPSGSGW